jgi:phosphoserine phosphatase RsbU/P
MSPAGDTFVVLRSITVKPNAHSGRSRNLLPAEIPEIQGASCSAVYYGQRRGGDFYDFVRSAEDRIWFGLFDVAGRLEETRAVACALQERFRACAPELVGRKSGSEEKAMVELWFELNQAVMRSAEGVRSCPAFIATYNEDLQSLCYLNAGHTSGLLRHQQRIRELEATALPLGLFSQSLAESSIVLLEAGDAILVISRGIVEAQSSGQEFGIGRAKQYLAEVAMGNAHELCLGILSRVRQFMNTTPTHNDVTALALVRAAL